MKKTLLIALLLIPFWGFSQAQKKSIDGFLGIKFGSSRADVTAAIQARGGILGEKQGPNYLVFSNVSLGQHRPEYLLVQFDDDKAYEADFLFKPQDDYHVVEYYTNLNNDITDVYGKGVETKKTTKTAADDKEEEIGDLLTGEADYHTLWTSPENKNIIISIIEKNQDNLAIRLIYQDSALVKSVFSKQKTKDKGDF